MTEQKRNDTLRPSLYLYVTQRELFEMYLRCIFDQSIRYVNYQFWYKDWFGEKCKVNASLTYIDLQEARGCSFKANIKFKRRGYRYSRYADLNSSLSSTFPYVRNIYVPPECARIQEPSGNRAERILRRKMSLVYLCARDGNLFRMKFSQTVLVRWVFLALLRSRVQRTTRNYTAWFTMKRHSSEILSSKCGR